MYKAVISTSYVDCRIDIRKILNLLSDKPNYDITVMNHQAYICKLTEYSYYLHFSIL